MFLHVFPFETLAIAESFFLCSFLSHNKETMNTYEMSQSDKKPVNVCAMIVLSISWNEGSVGFFLPCKLHCVSQQQKKNHLRDEIIMMLSMSLVKSVHFFFLR